MIYDCFLFFNELDLLEIRLNELDDVIDKFVLVESSRTFSSKTKPYYFDQNRDRFKRFLHKIIHVKVDDLPPIPPRQGRMGTFHNRHDVESFQRNCVSRGLVDCNPNDIILLSDIDEIPRPQSVRESIKILEKDKNSFITFTQKFYYYFLNGLCVNNKEPEPWLGTTACIFSSYPGSQGMRDMRRKSSHTLQNAGWHFSFLGGEDAIAYKIESFAHAEWDNEKVKDRKRLKQSIETGQDIFGRNDKPRQVYVKIDDTFPKYLLENLDKYSHLVRKNP